MKNYVIKLRDNRSSAFLLTVYAVDLEDAHRLGEIAAHKLECTYVYDAWEIA